MRKAELRRQMLARRRALSAAELGARSAQVAERLFGSVDFGSRQTVHVFLPVQRQRELDTWLIINRLWQEFPAVRVAVPVADLSSPTLTHFLLTPETELHENAWGIPEPLAAEQISASEIDLVLVPLLAFDGAGHRVGYGKGFYDHFLQQCPDAQRIGLSLEPPVAQISDAWDGDVRLHACVTPDKVYWF